MFPVKPEPFQVDQIRPDGRGKGRMGDLIKVFPDPALSAFVPGKLSS